MKKILIKIWRCVGLIITLTIMFVIGTLLGGFIASSVAVDEFRQLSKSKKSVETE